MLTKERLLLLKQQQVIVIAHVHTQLVVLYIVSFQLINGGPRHEQEEKLDLVLHRASVIVRSPGYESKTKKE